MKKAIVTLTIAVSSILLSTATIRTVSNNASSPGQYSSLPAAITASAVGDTIYVQGSPTSYGSITINKKLTFIGAGYAPDSTDYNLASKIDQILFDTTTYTMSGIKIIGFYIYATSSNTLYYSTSPTDDRGKINNVTFERCYISSGYSCSISGNNWEFLNCIFEYSNNLDIGTYNNILFSNCIIINTVMYNSDKSSINIYNCIFLNHISNAFSNVSNMGIYNSIFYNSSNTSCTNCLFMNNISYDNVSRPFTGTGTGNLADIDPLFVTTSTTLPSIGTTIPYSDLKKYNWALQTGSPGHNAGTDGTDIGFYGGSYPYKNITGMNPNIPVIKSFIVKNPVAQKGGTLQISIKAQKLQ
jgi:hypothetical protein